MRKGQREENRLVDMVGIAITVASIATGEEDNATPAHNKRRVRA